MILDIPERYPPCERRELERSYRDIGMMLAPGVQPDTPGEYRAEESVKVEEKGAGDDNDNAELAEEEPVDVWYPRLRCCVHARTLSMVK